jgi:hypothetical protein
VSLLPKQFDTPPKRIPTIKDLQAHLQIAIQLEHSTIPPYLVAMYSIKADSNWDAIEIIRTVVVEEMLHMILAANVLNAIGGAPLIDHASFVPDYPVTLPIAKEGRNLIVPLLKFSHEALDTFLTIEESTEAVTQQDTSFGELYGSIAEFYQNIKEALVYFADPSRYGQELFSGDPNRQITNKHYYNSGGNVVFVHDLESALQAIELIVDQSHAGGDLFSDNDKISHYYRFNEIKIGRKYSFGDTTESGPTGSLLNIQWDKVYNMIPNPKTAIYPKGSELEKRSNEFNEAYTKLLQLLHAALNGRQHQLIPAIVHMFSLKEKIVALLKNPIPNMEQFNAGPSFEYIPGVTHL